MKTTMIAFAASTAVATAAVKDVSRWVSVTTPTQNTKCYTEAEAPAKEKWTRTSECKKYCGAYPQLTFGLPGTMNGDKCGDDDKPASSGEYSERSKCVGSWKTVNGKCGDEDEKGRRPACTTGGTAEKTVDNEFKCLNQDGDDFALDADKKCPAPVFIPSKWLPGVAAMLTKAEVDTAIDAAEKLSQDACDLANKVIAGSCTPTVYKKKTCAEIPKCAPTMWVQTNPCKDCGQAATTDEAMTYKCVDQKYDEIALVDDKCGDGVLGGAKKGLADKQSCPAKDACDTYPACPLASGAEKVAMTAAVAIAAIAMF